MYTSKVVHNQTLEQIGEWAATIYNGSEERASGYAQRNKVIRFEVWPLGGSDTTPKFSALIIYDHL